MIHAPQVRRLAANDSYTFLMKELEKVDEKILEPLTGTDWPRDMPVITGGGLIESISSIDVSYASTGLEDNRRILTRMSPGPSTSRSICPSGSPKRKRW